MCAKCKRRVESLETAMTNLTKFKRSVAVLMCAKCKRRVESLETAMMNLTKFKRSVAVLESELSLHAIIVS